MYPIKLYFKDKTAFFLNFTLLVVSFYSWWYVFSKVPKNADQVFLHYNIIFGVDLAGSWWKLLLLPLGITITAIINFGLSWKSFGSDRALAKILLVGGVVAVLIAMTALVLIVGLNV